MQRLGLDRAPKKPAHNRAEIQMEDGMKTEMWFGIGYSGKDCIRCAYGYVGESHSTRGISRERQFRAYCPNCGKKFNSFYVIKNNSNWKKFIKGQAGSEEFFEACRKEMLGDLRLRICNQLIWVGDDLVDGQEGDGDKCGCMTERGLLISIGDLDSVYWKYRWRMA